MQDHLAAQVTAALVDSINQTRAADVAHLQTLAAQEQLQALAAQESVLRQQEAFEAAMHEMKKMRDFINDPSHIQGSDLTKHGAIAERLEVSITRARDLLHGLKADGTYLAPPNGPVDYVKHGVDVQQKFINGARNTLDHVREHLEKYAGFGHDGSYYEIPKDQHEMIARALRGEAVDGLNDRSVRTLVEKAREIAESTGRPFEEAVRPSLSSYKEVQQGVIHKTLDGHEDALRVENGKLLRPLEEKQAAHTRREKELETAAQDRAQPSLEEAGQAALAGGTVGGGMAFASAIFSKCQQGKNPFRGDFTTQDWKDVGVQTAKGGATGAISGATIYWLTNNTGLSAPFAGAVVSAAFAVKSIVERYKSGKIDQDECVALGQITCAEAALVAIGSTLGQTLIPIPVLGALIGSTAARIFTGLVTKNMGEHAAMIGPRLERQYRAYCEQLDREHRSKLEELNRQMHRLGDLISEAFDVSRNADLRLRASIDLAIELDVPPEKIIETDEQLDVFMLGRVVKRVGFPPRQRTRS